LRHVVPLLITGIK